MTDLRIRSHINFVAAVAVLIGFSVCLEAKVTMTDQKIMGAVERKLISNPRVPGHVIDVSVTDGIVTLSGSVNNLLAQDWAIKSAESIRGVRSVVDRIDIKVAKRSDRNIRKDIEKALLFDPATDSYEISPHVHNGVVRLEGIVQSWAEKNLAEQVVKGVKGITEVKNDIIVEYKETRPDSEIKAEIERRLENDPYVNETLIDVDVNQGIVNLTGSVGSAAAITYTAIDAWVVGVKQVNNRGLKVEEWLKSSTVRNKKEVEKSDTEIKKAVSDALFFDPRVKSFHVDVEVDNGDVTLKGIVDNLKAKRSAGENARNTIGVGTVTNNIKVRLESFPLDQDIENRVEAAFNWDPILDRYDLDAKVRNNMVYLYGTVDSRYEKWHAEDVASGLLGVVEVKNFIQILETWDWAPDSKIKEDIESELFWSPFVDSDEINVEVKEGRAILTGTVSDSVEYDAAIENAWEGGARIVESRLQLKEGSDFYPVIYDAPYFYGWY